MTTPQSEGHGDCASGGGLWLVWATAVACALAIVWMCLGWDSIGSRDSYVGKKSDYYNSQVHGFLSGHLYMDALPYYADWASPDPNVRVKRPYLLDASYFKGHYYLYFGVTPAALILLPYSWLTGSDLDPRFIVAFCAVAGFLFSAGILRMAMRDHIGRAGPWFAFAAAVVLAFSTAVPSLLTRALFYEIAIASGYACTMSGAFWTYRAVSGHGRTCLQLALASLSFGLAVGCRPDFVLNAPIPIAAAFLIAWRGDAKAPGRRSIVQMAAASAVPAGCIGILLAVYNYERFGNPSEFGVSYSVNTFMTGTQPLFSRAYLWPNIHWYYLTLPALSPYFPYVFPEDAYFGPAAFRWGEMIHGQFPVLVLGTCVLSVALLLRKHLQIGRMGAYLCLLAWMFLALFSSICAIGFRGDRYMVDFQPALVVGIVLLAGAVLSVLGKGLLPGLCRAAFAGLAGLSVAFNIFAGLQEFDAFKNIRSSTFQALERLGNYPAYAFERMGLLPAGPIRLTVVFPTKPAAAVVEPLLSAGTSEYTDSLYVIESATGRQIELLGDHSGYGGPRSEPIAITPGQTYTLTIDMGALYPPLSQPFIGVFNATQSRILKTGIRVEMDGKTVLDRKMRSYDAPPWSVEIGRNNVTMNPFKTEFSGRILSATRLPPPVLLENENNGLWRIRCTFPLNQPDKAFPLLSAGITGSATLVYLNVLPGNAFRFGVDEWGYGGGFSGVLKSTPEEEHTVEILIGPLARKTKWPKEWGDFPEELAPLDHDLRVWMDGRLVWSTKLQRTINSVDQMFDVGANRQGFTTAEEEYPGLIQSRPYMAGEARDFLARNFRLGP